MTAPRRWQAGQTFAVNGLEFRVRGGRKGLGDLVLDYHLPSGWSPVPMAVTFLMVDFFYENEHHLYPPPRYAGGEYLFRRLRLATRSGHEMATRLLDDEKASGQRGVQAALLPPTDASSEPEGARSAIFDYDEDAA